MSFIIALSKAEDMMSVIIEACLLRSEELSVCGLKQMTENTSGIY